ncbi:MAG TPA: succinate dehydrogenase, cytochrome b556 subunit [Geminicoccaceae bacterium]|nr:succinate dehydrogenase, cytochrome b556 subunit [Geminicoccaceae bacterium]
MARADRPMSPHLQIYRWYPTMLLSIAHRVTGAALAAGLLLLTWWLVALASGPEAFARVQWLVDSWLGGLVLFVYTYVAFHHCLSGIRHLAWDAGYGFELGAAYRSGYAVVIGAAALTLIVWIAILIIG